jgi:ABC-2 type transport system permease protein
MTTSALPAVQGGVAHARDLSLAARQIRYEQRSFLRNRRAAFFTFVFPLMFFVLLASLNKGGRLTNHGGISYNTFFVPGILAYSVVLATFGSLLFGLAGARDLGVLKRIQGTPLPPWVFVAGRVGSAVVTGVLVGVAILALGRGVYGVEIRSDTLVALVLTLALGVVAFSALGIAVLRIAPTADAAPIVANVFILPLSFVSGVWFPTDDMPAWLNRLAEALPIKPLTDGLQSAFDPRTQAPGIVWHNELVLAAWAAAGVVLALHSLRHELRRG